MLAGISSAPYKHTEAMALHLCEDCFFQTLAYLKQERRTQHLFSEDGQDLTDNLGLVARMIISVTPGADR